MDAANKRFSLVVELKSAAYPRSLKIKIRKEVRPVKTETSIAYSSNSTVQVFMKTVALDDMMKSKIEAFLTRGEIRDAYDMEFLLKRGVPLEADGKIVKRLLAGLQKLGKKDYSVKLGSLLPPNCVNITGKTGFDSYVKTGGKDLSGSCYAKDGSLERHSKRNYSLPLETWFE